MTDSDHERIGQCARRYRRVQGKTLDEVAGLAGITKSYLSMLESGKRRWDSRNLTDSVAAALGIRSTELIGSPFAPDSPAEASAQQAVTPIYKAHLYVARR